LDYRRGAAARAAKGDFCDLKLGREGFELVVPCRIVNIREQGDEISFGLKHEINDAATEKAYRQFLEIVAVGAMLKPHFKEPKPDASGYLVEQCTSD
jgi:hypothetical protein